MHIPFCRKACHYCDFHFSTSLKGRDDLLSAMNSELIIRKEYLEGEKVETIYFGGGTPSLLSVDELKRFVEVINNIHEVDSNPEITLEGNPDDLTKEKIRELKGGPVNRLSIGIQSFRENDLRWMNRAHNASQSEYAVKLSQDAGFDNITIDLIYSIPGMSIDDWKENIQKAISLDVNHISAYSLTIEPKTFFGHQEKKGSLRAVEQETSEEQFLLMCELLSAAGYEQYEVSNFAREGCRSRHNTSYWEGKKYIGIGPSAHSFNGKSRQWNISNNAVYTRAIMTGESYFEQELLDDRIRLNEYIMTRLRTSAGIDLGYISQAFGIDVLAGHEDMIEDYQRKGKILRNGQNLKLTGKGFLLADRIASDLFIVEV